MPCYEVYVHRDVVEALASAGAQRRHILRFIDRLQGKPDKAGDYTDRDFFFRDRQAKVVGGYAITYWPDHAARTVMVVGLNPADR